MNCLLYEVTKYMYKRNDQQILQSWYFSRIHDTSTVNNTKENNDTDIQALVLSLCDQIHAFM